MYKAKELSFFSYELDLLFNLDWVINHEIYFESIKPFKELPILIYY